ncbi:MAG: ATP-binding protein, partial [Actinomycetia bacterium]|nr:ATP-binding protein [Actinomycetes bacterium]
ACDVHKSENPEVLIDLGTNGELSLGSRHGIVSCATAAGPVFEGANIFFGMPALPGAISEVWEEGDRLAYNTIGDAEPKGICGTGLIDAVAYMLRKGLVDETGYLLEASECPEHAAWLGQENSGSVFYLTADHRIYITQRDIRNIQLGKSAVYSGLMVLLDEAGLDLQGVTKLFIAGGFGKKLNLESAATVGIIPRAWLDRAVAVGNSSVEGASAALLSAEARQDMLALWDITKYIELSITARFNDYFVENMMFPEA